ncbi:MAG: pyruvate:ferredoxin (flavodoxin) oxidoreductase [Firmicutes bacterium]|nr:pyruvate:ferredoxin (flavodoxin) oxidoreductase [Bacillota bacterium]
MNKKTTITNGNSAASRIAYYLSEAAAIYPITPSSDMAELNDRMAASGIKNVFGQTTKVVELQSEAGAAGALHGLISAGALATTFTASQGLLLMIPNMFKIAGELSPTVIHVSARALAMHSLNIFGDHSDVMACRQTGFSMLASNSVQEAQDMSLAAHLATVESSVPFLHFFDGFRTSHEMNTIEEVDEATLKTLINQKKIDEFKARALTSSNPHCAGTAQNPDTYFQNREACNTYYNAVPEILQQTFNKIATVTGRQYNLFDYYGSPTAKHVVVAMGSACETIEETIEALGNKDYGLIKVRLYRPFSVASFINALPKTVQTITVLDRTKESGSVGEPLYTDVATALLENGKTCKLLGGRYGLGGKDFTPAQAKAVLENKTKNHFTVGITDDVTNTSLVVEDYTNKSNNTECLFYGLGSDGTVSANKNSISVIASNTNMYTQAYFEYDSKKSGGVTISHLRFGNSPIKSTYLSTSPSFVACHAQSYLNRYDMLKNIKTGGTFLLNTTYSNEELNQVLPNKVKEQIKAKQLKVFTINAYEIANQVGLGGRINTIMQTAFFYLTSIIDFKKALELLKDAALKSYGTKNPAAVQMNCDAMDKTCQSIKELNTATLTQTSVTDEKYSNANLAKLMSKTEGIKYYNDYSHPIETLKGNTLPVSSFDHRGFVPTGTSQFEKREISVQLPRWISENCIQCNQCAIVCPHATIRPYLLEEKDLKGAPSNFVTLEDNQKSGKKYRLQLNPHDCTGCGICANVCPSRNKALVMEHFVGVRKAESDNYIFSTKLPYQQNKPNANGLITVKNSQFNRPYFEFSGACTGCGETPYIKLLTQLFGDRLVIANATGCTSIYSASSPTCPYTKDEKGFGPAWSNSLFEDTAEFGYGMKLAKNIIANGKGKQAEIAKNQSVWAIGGDGWAYDIGFGGLDHVIASGENINILVLDTEVYSNTGGQMSKATPRGATAAFAASGKQTCKKDLGAIAQTYKNVYVASVCIGANMQQTVNAFVEAESYDGPSIIIAYSTCINHGIKMENSMQIMKEAVTSGYWPLYRYNPRNQEPLTIDSKAVTTSIEDFKKVQNRFRVK